MPQTLYILWLIGDVGVRRINPKTQTLIKLLDLAFVFPYAFLCLGIEFCDAVLFYFFFIVDTEFLFHFDFYGKPVCIPTNTPFRVISAHGFVPRPKILKNQPYDVSHVWQSIGC